MKGETAKIALVYVGILSLFLFFYSADMLSVVGQKTINYNYYATEVFEDDGEVWATYTPDYKIGDWKFHSSPLGFACEDDDDFNMPEPEAECWKTNVTFGGKNFNFTVGEPVQIGPYLTSYFTGSGSADEGIIENPDDFSLTYYFNVDTDGFSARLGIENKEVLFGSNTQIPILIRNNIAPGMLFGVQIKYTPLLFYTEDYIVEKFVPAPMGDSRIYVTIPTDYLGNMEVDIYPYLIFGDVKVFNDESDKTIILVSETASPLTEICTHNNDCAVGSVCTYEGCKVVNDVTYEEITSGEFWDNYCPITVCYDSADACDMKLSCECEGDLYETAEDCLESIEIPKPDFPLKIVLIIAGVILLIMFIDARKK